MEEAPRVSVVVPSFNQEQQIEESLRTLLAYLREAGPELGQWEVLVVDDGSQDRTAQVVSVNFPTVKLLRQPRNRGKGAAVRRGMLEASGRYRFFVDADLPFDLSVLKKMIHYLDFKEFDLCIGTRSLEQYRRFAPRSWLRRLASWIFTAVVSRVVVTGVRDTQCGFKGFRAEAAEYLFSQSRVDRFAFDVEILYLAFKSDLDIKRLPVALCRQDRSTVSVVRDGLEMLLSIAKIPLRYYLGLYTIMPGCGERGGA